MSPREAFKVGFLLWCADRGFTPEQTRDFVKHAKSATKVAWWLGSPVKTILSVGGPLAGLAVLAGIGTPVAVGGLAGHGLAKAIDNTKTIEEVKADEILAEYQRLINQAERQLALKRIHKQPTLTPQNSQ